MLLIRYCFVFLCRINQHCRQCSSVTFVTSNNVKNICLFAFNFPQRLSQVSILVGKAIIRQYRKGLLQWGYYEASAVTYDLTFPIAFNSECYFVSAIMCSPTASANYAIVKSKSKTGATISNSTRENLWFALGK